MAWSKNNSVLFLRTLTQAAGLLLFLVVLSVGFSACRKGNSSAAAPKGKLLAEVNGKELYQADIEPGLVPPGVSSLDSGHIMDVYVENWVRKQLLLQQAEEFASSNPDIDILVKEYYNSLIIQQYENALVREKLDSNISVQQYQAYYDAHKEQYLLEDTHVRSYFIKARNNTPGLSDLRAVWLPGARLDYNKVLVFCNANRSSVDFLLEENKWVMLDVLQQKLPADALTSWHLAGNDLVTSDDDYTYFLRIFESAQSGTIAPLSFVMKDIRDIMLYQRRSELIEQVTKELYQKAQQDGDLQIH